MQGSVDVTQILESIKRGEPGAQDRLFEAVYEELRQRAHRRMVKEGPGLTLQTTALVNEAYLRLVSDEKVRWENRAHFFGAAAEAMRRILVERARKYRGQKHGGGRKRFPLQEDAVQLDDRSLDLLALDEALNKLEVEDERKSEVVKYRYFLGMTVEETAELLGVAPRTVDNDWKYAKAWLRGEITKGDSNVS